VRVRGVAHSTLGEKILTDSFELLGALGLVLYGVILLISRQVPNSLLVVAPHWAILVWGGVLAAGGALVVYGMFRSLALEVAGLMAIAGACLAYGVVLPFHYGIGGLAAVSFSASFGIAAAIRAYSIILARRITEAVLRDSH
jgi:hypothetical protein